MNFSKSLYKLILCIWCVVVLAALILCPVSDKLAVFVLPVVFAGFISVLLLTICYKITQHPTRYAVITIVILHVISYLITYCLTKGCQNEFDVWVAPAVNIASLAVCIVQSIMVFNPRAIIPCVAVLIIIAVFIAVLDFIKQIFFPTTWYYCDMMIIGESQEEIIEEYGEFDKIFYFMDSDRISYAGYYLYEKSNVPYYYMISFDDTGKAVSTAIDGGWGG